MMSNLIVYLSSIKQPFGLPIFLNVISLLIAFVYIYKIREINRVYLYIILILFVSVIGNLFYSFDIISLLRSIQVIGLLLFSVYISRNLHNINNKLFIFIILGTSIVFLLELLFSLRYTRDFFGYVIPRLSGFHGDPNYNSVFIGVIFCLSIIKERRFTIYSFFLLLLLIPGFSRGAILGSIVFILTYKIYDVFPRLVIRCSFLLLLLLFMQPLLIHFIFYFYDDFTLQEINLISSDRLAHWDAYLHMAKSNIFGVGYFIGQTIEGNYLNYDLFPFVKPQQAHSMYFSTIADFGIVGYSLLLCAYLYLLKLSKSDKYRIALFNYMLMSFLSLNFLGEVSFWIIIAVLSSKAISINGVINRKLLL